MCMYWCLFSFTVIFFFLHILVNNASLLGKISANFSSLFRKKNNFSLCALPLLFLSIVRHTLNFNVRRVCGLERQGVVGLLEFLCSHRDGNGVLERSVHRNKISLHKSTQGFSPTPSTSSAWSELHLLSGGPNMCSEPWKRRQGCLTGPLPWFPEASFKLPKEKKSHSKGYLLRKLWKTNPNGRSWLFKLQVRDGCNRFSLRTKSVTNRT